MIHNRFWQAFFAIAPIVTMIVAIAGYIIFIISTIGNFQETESSGNVSASIILGNMVIFFILIMLAVLFSILSLIFYIVHAVQNPNLIEHNLLLVWILLFVFVSGIGQLIYWIIEILNKRKITPKVE